MSTVAIFPEPLSGEPRFRAISGLHQSVGRTPGEALDAVTAQLSEPRAGTLVLVQPMEADSFFTADQRRRLAELMDRWRSARDQAHVFPPEEQAELEALTEAEVRASTDRAVAWLRQLQP
jgi:hypothetical protein